MDRQRGGGVRRGSERPPSVGVPETPGIQEDTPTRANATRPRSCEVGNPCPGGRTPTGWCAAVAPRLVSVDGRPLMLRHGRWPATCAAEPGVCTGWQHLGRPPFRRVWRLDTTAGGVARERWQARWALPARAGPPTFGGVCTIGSAPPPKVPVSDEPRSAYHPRPWRESPPTGVARLGREPSAEISFSSAVVAAHSSFLADSTAGLLNRVAATGVRSVERPTGPELIGSRDTEQRVPSHNISQHLDTRDPPHLLFPLPTPFARRDRARLCNPLDTRQRLSLWVGYFLYLLLAAPPAAVNGKSQRVSFSFSTARTRGLLIASGGQPGGNTRGGRARLLELCTATVLEYTSSCGFQMDYPRQGSFSAVLPSFPRCRAGPRDRGAHRWWDSPTCLPRRTHPRSCE